MKKFLGDLLDGLLTPIGAIMMLPMMLAAQQPKGSTGEELDKLIVEQLGEPVVEPEVAVDPNDNVLEVIEFKPDENQ